MVETRGNIMQTNKLNLAFHGANIYLEKELIDADRIYLSDFSKPSRQSESSFSINLAKYSIECSIFTEEKEEEHWIAKRSILTLLAHNELETYLRILALFEWKSVTRYCSLCGSLLEDSKTETALVCTKCGRTTYPRISPAVIALVHKEDKILLARNANFKNGTFSHLAGFVEAGESLEAALKREIKEEVGIEIQNIRYRESQAWPFPESLMIGFEADYASGTLTPDGIEILEADWFSKDALPPLPMHGSLSRKLIDEWIKGE